MARLQLLRILFIVSILIIHVQAQYVGKVQDGDGNAVLKHTFELRCQYNGPDDNGQFIGWTRDDMDVNNEKPGHYAVSNTQKESVLTIKIFVLSDANVTTWQVKTSKPNFETPSECRFGPIPLKPSPQGIETNRPNEKIDSAHGSIRRSEDKSVVIKCIIEPPPANSGQNQVTWEFSKDAGTYTDIPEGVSKLDNQITIEKTKKSHNGFYRCEMNGVQFTVLLRVKDRLAALWPFIGIVSVVLILVIIIIIFEKRQKANKKSSTDDDEQDQANDPLVRTTANTSDSDNKKRTVNA